MSDTPKSHQQGMIDGIELWGRVCGKQGNCDGCPIGSIRGTNVTCQDFAKQFPAKMLSILKEMDKGELTYYEEYCTRFPECNLSVDVLSLAMCRKAVFEGFVDCPHADDEEACLKCWQEVYQGDVTEVSSEEEDTGLTSI